MIKIQLHRRNILFITLALIACFFLSITLIVVSQKDELKTQTASVQATTSFPEENSLQRTPLTTDNSKAEATSSTNAQDAPNEEETSTSEKPRTSETSPARVTPDIFDPIRNTNPIFSKYADQPEKEISLTTPGLMTPARSDNGSGQGQGQFRVTCNYSHFAYDDPIVFPNQPGKSHLHMFFGNTETDASSTKESLLNTGGGSCQGFELNRSAYWVPALIDGEGSAVVPDSIILYYKTYKPSVAKALPQGLQMIAGNVDKNNFDPSNKLFWSCGTSGEINNKSGEIQACDGKGQYLNATIVFPNCWDGENLGLKDMSHLKMVPNQDDCPSSHPVRFPQISILLYYPAASNVDGWHLSSDNESFRSGSPSKPGGTLHADWFGAWNDEAMNLFIGGCINPGKNCSGGQTGTANKFTKISNLGNYEGENYLKLPAGSYQRK